MKKETIFDIFVLLLTPTFLIAGVIKLFNYPIKDSYESVSNVYIALILLILGTLVVFTYSSLKNILLNFPRVNFYLSNLSAYLLSMGILLFGGFLISRYFWSLTSYISTSDFTLTQPVILNSLNPMVVSIKNLFTDMVFAIVFSAIITFILKKLVCHENRK